MKIALYSQHPLNNYTSRILSALREYAPQHQCHLQECQNEEPDLWHCFTPHTSPMFLLKAHRSVLSLGSVNFASHPEIYTLSERLTLLPLYRTHCLRAAKIITSNSEAKRTLIDSLGVDPLRVEVCHSLLAARLYDEEPLPTSDELLATRAKFELPPSYVLVVGDIDTLHNHTTIIHTLANKQKEVNAVIVGRHTLHSDVLLAVVRDNKLTQRVSFIYEIDHKDLLALYRMALATLYLPEGESSPHPIIDALRMGSPLILSDTPLNHEIASGAAIFVESGNQEQLHEAIKVVIYNESFRGQLIAQSRAEAKRYTSQSMADSLAAIYESTEL